MRKIITTVLCSMFLYAANAAVKTMAPKTTLDSKSAKKLASYGILGDSLRVSFWSFGASGFQIDYYSTNIVGLVGNAKDLKALKAGDLIDSKAKYANNETAYYPAMFSNDPNLIKDGQSTYLGFQLTKGTAKHYGWLKITRVSQDVVTVDSIGYDDAAGTAIKAGQSGTITSINDDILTNAFGIYPNPAREALNIKTKNATGIVKSIYLMNISGQLIVQEEVNKDSYRLDLRSLSNGIYMLRVVNEEGKSEYLRFVKE